MSWQERDYGSNAYQSQGAGRRGVGSWFGGLPPAGKAVKWIALANAAVFVLCMITGGYESWVFRAMAMQTDLVFEGQIWRLFTFTYAHSQGSPLHLLFNMIGLYFLGTPLERHWGTRRFFIFYTIGGFIAVLSYLSLTAFGWLPKDVPLVGASGGVLAVLGACAVLFPQIKLILVLFPVPIRTAALIFVVLYTFNLFSRGGNAGGDACHLAGLAFGVYWGYRGQGRMNRWDQRKARARQGAWDAKRQEMLRDELRIDAILQKVKDQGIGSLSRGEKKALEQATKQHQAQDRGHGL